MHFCVSESMLSLLFLVYEFLTLSLTSYLGSKGNCLSAYPRPHPTSSHYNCALGIVFISSHQFQSSGSNDLAISPRTCRCALTWGSQVSPGIRGSFFLSCSPALPCVPDFLSLQNGPSRSDTATVFLVGNPKRAEGKLHVSLKTFPGRPAQRLLLKFLGP